MEKRRRKLGRPAEGLGISIQRSPHKNFVDQLLAAGYPCDEIARILWSQYHFKTTGATVYNYKTTFFEPMKEVVKKRLVELEVLEVCAKRELQEVELLRKNIEELESEAEYLKPMRDQSSIRLRSEILYKAGSLRAKVMQLNSSQLTKEREEELLRGFITILVDTVFPYILEEHLPEVKQTLQDKLEVFLEQGVVK